MPRQLNTSIPRRAFLKLGGSLALFPATRLNPFAQESVFTLGLIADLHHGLAPDAVQRLESFMNAVDEKKPDAVLQLGDFNFGVPESRECMRLWNQFGGPKYHVLGNHDMDFMSKPAMVDFWEMPAPYYSFDRAGFHFVVLDRNSLKTPDGYVPYEEANFYVDASMRSFAEPEQLEWLAEDLQQTNLPTVVFSHQGLGVRFKDEITSEAASEIENILENTLDAAGQPKVHACFCGHHHIDRYIQKGGVHYVWINSASYYWVGEDYGRMAFYRDPLYAFLSFYTDGTIHVAGKSTDWIAPDPIELGHPDATELTTFISERSLPR